MRSGLFRQALKKKIIFYLRIVFMILGLLQLSGDIRMHLRQRETFIENFASTSCAVSEWMYQVVQTPDNSDKVATGLSWSHNCIEDLRTSIRYAPEYTILWKQRNALLYANPYLDPALSYVKGEIDNILREYRETNMLSSKSIAYIRSTADAFASFSESINNSHLSQKALESAIDSLCSSIYFYS